MNQHPGYTKSNGFTIVELLIVIIVLGILAALVISAFKGVRERAYNAKVLSNVRQYITGLEAYRAMYGVYPQTSGEQNGDFIAMTCLGRGYPGKSCGTVTSTVIFEDDVFYTQIGQVMQGTANQLGDEALPVSGESFTGAVYGIDTTIPKYAGSDGRARMIEYALMGSNADCSLPGSWGYNQSTNPATTACEIDLEPYEP